MCGIAGFIDKNSTSYSPDEIIRRMTDAIAHRGPDADGRWLDGNTGVALGHRRLSILDLSPEGNQPMVSRSGQFAIAFNGEIYNYLDIKKELEAGAAYIWRGHSDTEVMLAAIEKWGISGALKRFVGMFAFSLWDRQERSLTIARDRLGEKPLYYGWCKGAFMFASELKALRVHPSFDCDINRDALTLLLRHNYIPAPYSIYNGIRKLLPGTYLTVKAGRKDDTPIPYWSVHAMAEAGQSRPFNGSNQEAIDHLELLLRRSVRQQMLADVPLGAFLSGGIDSSMIVALMQAQSSTPVRTFTIGFHEAAYNEAQHAKAVARHLGTDHTELYITPQQALDVIPRLPLLYDEPFSDSSQVPTFLVSQMARRHVTVSLSGDAGDELFGGYPRYFLGRRIWNKIRLIPRPLRGSVARLINSVSPQKLNRVAEAFSYLIHVKLREGWAGDKMHKLAEIMDKESPEALYRELVSHWKSPASVVLDSQEPSTVITDNSQWAGLDDFMLRMMYLDTLSYLPDDILVKVDRAAMGVGLETRVPFLDHRVVEFAWKLPLSMKVHNGQGKWILKQLLNKYVPKDLIERPKMGFGVPIDSWLRGPLRDWTEELLNEKRLSREGYFEPSPIREKWEEHLSGKRNWQYYLWDVLMFQAWLEENSKH